MRSIVGWASGLSIVVACTPSPTAVAPAPSASSAPTSAASTAPAPSSAPSSVALADAGRAPPPDPCADSFAKRLGEAEEAIDDVVKERSQKKAHCAALKKLCTPRPGGTAAVCNGTSQADHDFFEDTCIRWSGVEWYDGTYTYLPGSVRKDCSKSDPVALTIEEGTFDDDVARIRGTRP